MEKKYRLPSVVVIAKDCYCEHQHELSTQQVGGNKLTLNLKYFIMLRCRARELKGYLTTAKQNLGPGKTYLGLQLQKGQGGHYRYCMGEVDPITKLD